MFLKNVKVKLKIRHDPSWRGDSRRVERYWVNLSDGKYFPIFFGFGQWHNMYAPHMGYPTAEASIAASLRVIYAPVDKTADYRGMREKEQVFTFNDEKQSTIKLPRKRCAKP